MAARLYRHIEDIPAEAKGGVVAIGNFDGVHRGHQVVVGKAAAAAEALGAPLTVMTFEPHTRTVVRPDNPVARITPMRTKVLNLSALGVEHVLALQFTMDLAGMPAEDFIEEILIKGLGVRHVVVGEDFCFGKKRSGNVHVLAEVGKAKGFAVTAVSQVSDGNGGVYSSSSIRAALREGQARQAADILGHWWEVDGRVAHGDKRGRTIGFPTANVPFDDYMNPRFGVYAVRMKIAGLDGWHDGVANIGMRPTFDKDEPLLEVHLFDFDGDIYDKHVRVIFVDGIRDEKHFDGLDALKAQIEADCTAAKKILNDEGNALTAVTSKVSEGKARLITE